MLPQLGTHAFNKAGQIEKNDISGNWIVKKKKGGGQLYSFVPPPFIFFKMIIYSKN